MLLTATAAATSTRVIAASLLTTALSIASRAASAFDMTWWDGFIAMNTLPLFVPRFGRRKFRQSF
jgi:hypothetical protein